MKPYKIFLRYQNENTLIQEYESEDIIVNADSLEFTFSRHELYEGLFFEMIDSLQFTGVDKAFLDDTYFDWKNKMDGKHTLLIEIQLFDNITLKYESQYNGIVSWSDFQQNETITEVVFNEHSDIINLLESGKDNYLIEPLHSPKQITVNVTEGVGEHCPLEFSSKEKNESWNLWRPIPRQIIDDNNPCIEQNKILSFKGSSEDEYTNVIKSRRISQNYDSRYIVSVKFVDIYKEVTVMAHEVSQIPTRITLEIRSAVKTMSTIEYVLLAEIYSQEIVEVGSDRYLGIFHLDEGYSKWDILNLTETEIPPIEMWLEYRASYEDGSAMTQITMMPKTEYEVTKLQVTQDINLASSLAVFHEIQTKIGTDINMMHWADNDLLDNIHFTSNAGLLKDDIKINISFEDVFKELKTIGFIGLFSFNQGGFSVMSLNNIYDNTRTIIDLGEATKLTTKLNSKYIFSKFNIGTGERTNKETKSGYSKNCEFKIYNSLDNTFEKKQSKVQRDHNSLGFLFLDIFNKKLKKEQKPMIVMSQAGDKVISKNPVTKTKEVDAYFYGNTEYSPTKIFAIWRNWIASSLTDFNSIEYIGGDINKEAQYTDSQVGLLPTFKQSYDKSFFSNFVTSPLFGTNSYEIEIPLEPKSYDLIRKNNLHRFSVTYKGEKIVFFIRNVGIQMLTGKVAKIKAIQSFKNT